MKTIWKYALGRPGETVHLYLPTDWTIAKVAAGHIWLMHSQGTSTGMTEISVLTVGTGDWVPEDSVHLGTWFEGPFVWHAIQEIKA